MSISYEDTKQQSKTPEKVGSNKIRCSKCLEQKIPSKMLNKGYRQVCKECDE